MVREVATPRRRSSRLRGLSPQKQLDVATPHLIALEEDNEVSYSTAQPVKHAKLQENSTAPETTETPLPKRVEVTTPQTVTQPRPSFEEMHPSRFQSTSKKMGIGKRLSTVNARTYMQTPSKSDISADTQSKEPPRIPKSIQKSFASPDFEFRFRQSTDMSTDTQKMMDDIREQATRIKEGLAAQREQQLRKDDEAEALYGRKLATPKGKLGRFSDVHVGQFKKMDSIANHPSAFRAEPLKITASNTNPLKRNSSKTSLGKSEVGFSGAGAVGSKSLKRSPSKAELDKPDTPLRRLIPGCVDLAFRQDEITSPAKRQKQQHDARSSTQAQFRECNLRHATSGVQQSKSGIPMMSTIPSITTPTKATLARSASVKNLKSTTSMIPSLARSPSMKNLTTPAAASKPIVPHTEGSKKYANSFASKISNVKSILRRPQIRFSDDPVKIAAGTHLSTPTKTTADAQKTNPLLPSSKQFTPGSPAHRKEKHVNFPKSPGIEQELSQLATPYTPSPTKMPGQFPLAYPDLPPINTEPMTPTHPGLSGIRIPGLNTTPGDFTFRADKTISFAPQGRTTPTIRKVRASDVAAYANLNATTPKLSQLTHVPHGLSNKKRKRDSRENDLEVENKENIGPDVVKHDHEQESGSPAKRARVTETVTPTKPSKPVTPASRIPKYQKSRGFLSLGRLNALSKPKERK